MQSLLLLAFVPLCLAQLQVIDDPLRQPRRCPGGYSEGQEAVMGRYYYKCQDGELEPMGCINDRGQRVPLWETTDTQNQDYRFECVRDRDGFLQFAYKACLFQGKPYLVNERWTDDKYIYVCLKEGDYLRQEIDGCVYQNREVGINQKVKNGNFLYQCKKTENGTCSMCPVGCAHNDREYSIGETFEDGRNWFSCEKANSRITLAPKGCVNDGKRFSDNDHFLRGDTAYECQVDKDKVVEKVAGCAARDERGQLVEKMSGTIWNDGDFEVQCKVDQSTNQVSKVPVRCSYKLSNGSPLVLEPGCYRTWENQAIGCWKDPSSAQLQLKKLRLDDIGLPVSDGLRFC